MATGRTEASGPSPKLASNREQTVWGVVLFDQAIPRKVPFHRHKQEGRGARREGTGHRTSGQAAFSHLFFGGGFTGKCKYLEPNGVSGYFWVANAFYYNELTPEM